MTLYIAFWTHALAAFNTEENVFDLMTFAVALSSVLEFHDKVPFGKTISNKLILSDSLFANWAFLLIEQLKTVCAKNGVTVFRAHHNLTCYYLVTNDTLYAKVLHS